MALWGSRQPDLQSRIEDIQTGLSALAGLLGDGAGLAGKGAARGAHAAQEAVSEKAADMSAALGPAIADITNQIDSIISSASSLTGRAASVASEQGGKAYRAVEDKVENNAMMAVVAAAGVGFLIGTMIFGGSAAKRAVTNLIPGEEQPRRRAQARTVRRGKPRSRKAA
jgi:ElaB/YqjD/DUF883 family membrane-anchored ribosome-binding protein